GTRGGQDPLSPSAAAAAAVPSAPVVIEWRCSPQFQNTSLYPVRDFFERMLGLGRSELPAARFDRLVRYLDQFDLGRADTVPLFAALLSLAPDDRFPPLGLAPVREREELFRALPEWLPPRA